MLSLFLVHAQKEISSWFNNARKRYWIHKGRGKAKCGSSPDSSMNGCGMFQGASQPISVDVADGREHVRCLGPDNDHDHCLDDPRCFPAQEQSHEVWSHGPVAASCSMHMEIADWSEIDIWEHVTRSLWQDDKCRKAGVQHCSQLASKGEKQHSQSWPGGRLHT